MGLIVYFFYTLYLFIYLFIFDFIIPTQAATLVREFEALFGNPTKHDIDSHV
jgi:hypothetical protein